MPYKDEAANAKADKAHERTYPGDMTRLHTLEPRHYDTPGSIHRCACLACNQARVAHGTFTRTWQGVARMRR